MSKEKRRVPKLRFPGFTEDWEQRKLSDISTKVTTKNVDVHYTETLTNSAEQGIISQADFFDKEISNKDNINGYYIVENNDFIYNPRISTLAPVGPINRNKLNRTGIMSPLYTVFRASKVDLGFLEWYFQSNHWHRYMKLNGDSGARADRIAIKDSTFFEMPIKTPVNIKEQVLIGETLEKFNQYITLHQRKLDNLKLKKKALLQKLFPKNGERYPELRFPGFTDAWEQCKFGDLFEYERPDAYIVKSDNYNNDFNMPVLTANKAFILGYTNEENSYNKPSIIFDDFTLDRKYVDFPYMLKSSAIKILISKNQHNLRFLFERLNSTRFEVLGHARHYISVVQNTTTLCPFVDEEVCISNLLTKFDELITLHQRKLNHLQLQKKALLQQMFV